MHFPTWALGLRQARLEGARSLEEALDRVVAAREHVREGGWLRGLGWREGDWTEPPTRAALDRAVPDVPVALMSKDYHSLWLNSAALERADGPLEVPGGVVEESGILRENAAWAFRDRYVRPTLDEMVEASREGMRVAASRGVVAIHDKDGWLGAFEVHERLLRDGDLLTRVWQSFPWDRLDDLREPRHQVRLRRPDAPLRLPEGLHGRDARLRHRPAAGRLGRGDQLARGARGRGAPGGRRRLAGGGARDRRRREPCRARRLRGHPRRVGAARPAPADRARAAAGRRRRGALRRDRRGGDPCSSATRPRTATSRSGCGRARQGAYAYRSLLDAGATLANGSDAPVEELDPLAGIVAGVLRTHRRAPAVAPRAGGDGGGGAPRDLRGAQRGWSTPRTAAAASAPEWRPTS